MLNKAHSLDVGSHRYGSVIYFSNATLKFVDNIYSWPLCRMTDGLKNDQGFVRRIL